MKYYTTEDLGKRWGINKITVLMWVSRGRIKQDEMRLMGDERKRWRSVFSETTVKNFEKQMASEGKHLVKVAGK